MLYSDRKAHTMGVDPGMIDQTGGMKIVASSFLTKNVQVKFPRSKKKRMRKKWSRNLKYFKSVPDETSFYIVDLQALSFLPSAGMKKEKMIVAHPNIIAKIEGLKES